MRLLSCEQTAHYHIKAADIAVMNGLLGIAAAHIKAAHYAMHNDRTNYLRSVTLRGIERFDQGWQAQKNLEAA
jgi:hypothetical protein